MKQYGFDGIDIDDEYDEHCQKNTYSLIMAAAAIREAMPDKILSKPLWNDHQYFDAVWNGKKLGSLLTYGWEMSYGSGDAGRRLQPYLKAGMSPNRLGVGAYEVETPVEQVKKLTREVKTTPYGGMMIYNVYRGSARYMSNVSQELYGQNVSEKPNCIH